MRNCLTPLDTEKRHLSAEEIFSSLLIGFELRREGEGDEAGGNLLGSQVSTQCSSYEKEEISLRSSENARPHTTGIKCSTRKKGE